jgi:hypothetical protein
MVIALTAYLEESGIEVDKVTGELARYFKAPAPYEQALKERLVDHLTRRGQKLLADGEQAPALDVFDRVLTVDPHNEKVLGILDNLNRRARVKTIMIGALAVTTIALGGYMVHRRSQPPPPKAPPEPSIVNGSGGVTEPNTQVTRIEQPPLDVDALGDAGVGSASGGSNVVVIRPVNGGTGGSGSAVAPEVDAGIALATRSRRVLVQPAKDSEVKFGNLEWAKVTAEDGAAVRLVEGDVLVTVRNTCCEEKDQLVRAGTTEVSFSLQALPANVVPMCDAPGDISVTVNGKPAILGKEAVEVFAKNTTQFTKVFRLEFTGEHVKGTPIERRVAAGQKETVHCEPR